MKNLKKFAALLLVGAMALPKLPPVAAAVTLARETRTQRTRPLTDLRQRHRQVA